MQEFFYVAAISAQPIMILLQILFWLLLIGIFYSYFGYGLIILLLNLFKKKKPPYQTLELPAVTLIIASHNEAKILAARIENALELDYPKEKIAIILIDDGSSDETEEVISNFQIKYLKIKTRGGKAAAINYAMQFVSTPLTVLSDANCMMNKESIKKIVPHFNNEKVGGVAGEKKIISNEGMGSAEGLYWKYESQMKKFDASFYSVVGATGELFALRTHLFKNLDKDVILDDLMLSLQICLQDFVIAYEPAAYATERASVSLQDEKKRKIRIAAGAFQILEKISWNKIKSNSSFSFQFISRRWFRWVFSPVAVIILLPLNIILAFTHPSSGFEFLLYMQVGFYAAAFIGYILLANRKSFFVFTIPFYFLFMNYCMIAGYFRNKQKRQTVLWEKAQR